MTQGDLPSGGAIHQDAESGEVYAQGDGSGALFLDSEASGLNPNRRGSALRLKLRLR